MEICPGIIIIAMTKAKITFLPLKLYFASANPIKEEINTLSTTEASDTIIELAYAAKYHLEITIWKFSIR